MKNHRIKDLLAGALIASILCTLLSPTFATMTGKTIEAFTGIKVYVNDHIVEPKDAGGNPVDIFVYNGTTYLPIRAIGNALGLPVQYDASTETAYIGTHRSETPAVYLENMDYFYSAYSGLTTAFTEDDNLGQTHTHCITRNVDRVYKLNGQYSKITGTMYQTYTERSASISSGSGIMIYADGKLVYSKIFEKDTVRVEPVDFEVDLTGVLELQVTFFAGSMGYSWNTVGNAYSDSVSRPLSLGDVALYT